MTRSSDTSMGHIERLYQLLSTLEPARMSFHQALQLLPLVEYLYAEICSAHADALRALQSTPSNPDDDPF
jgi:hypothetical protein